VRQRRLHHRHVAAQVVTHLKNQQFLKNQDIITFQVKGLETRRFQAIGGYITTATTTTTTTTSLNTTWKIIDAKGGRTEVTRIQD
jgi:hypothetical protein